MRCTYTTVHESWVIKGSAPYHFQMLLSAVRVDTLLAFHVCHNCLW